MDCNTKSEFIDRFYNDAGLEVESASPDVLVIGQAVIPCVLRIIFSGIVAIVSGIWIVRSGLRCETRHIGSIERFPIIGILLKIYVGYSETYAPVQDVHYIAAEIERVLIDMSFLFNIVPSFACGAAVIE